MSPPLSLPLCLPPSVSPPLSLLLLSLLLCLPLCLSPSVSPPLSTPLSLPFCLFPSVSLSVFMLQYMLLLLQCGDKIDIQYTDYETMNHKWLLYLICILLKTLAFSPAQRLWALEPGSNMMRQREETAQILCFFLSCLAPFFFHVFCFFVISCSFYGFALASAKA
jgi:hypothetical protein